MRKELNEYLEKNPYSLWMSLLLNIREFFIIKIWLTKFKIAKVGSPYWHILQEKLANKSSVGKDMKLRNMFYRNTMPLCGEKLCVHPKVIFSYPQNIEIGYNLFLNRGVFITAPTNIKIGDNVLIGPYVVINSGSHKYNDSNIIIRDQGHKLLPIIINNDVWIGSHVTILPGVIIGEGAVIAANAVVSKDVPPYSVFAGIPAKEIRRRK